MYHFQYIIKPCLILQHDSHLKHLASLCYIYVSFKYWHMNIIKIKLMC